MKISRKYIFILFAICAVVFIGGVVFYFVKRNSAEESAVTCYNWLELLEEQFGRNEYGGESPYFGVAETDINEEEYASGEFIALTAMKTIGESKLRIYLGTEGDITDDTCIELAVRHGLVEEEKLNKIFSEEECKQVLETLQNLYFGEFWRDDHYHIIYNKSVTELTSADVLRSNTGGSAIMVPEGTIDSYEVGSVIVFEQENTKLKLARKVTEIGSDGTLSLEPAELDEVVESVTISDITELTFEDIINYYGLKDNKSAFLMSKAGFSAQMNSKGFKLSLSTKGEDENRYLEIKVTDNATGISYALPVSDKVESKEDEYSAEIDIDKIYIGGQIDYSLMDGLKYAEAAIDVHATFKSTIKAKKEKKILLFETPVPIGNGIVGADIQIYIVLSVDGSISFEAELPVEVSVSYEKGRGLRNFEHRISVEDPVIEANCNAGAMLRFEPAFVILGCLNVMDAEADIGVTASAQIVTRPDSQICADVSVSFPVMTLSVCGDDDADTIIGSLGLSAEWEIISSENAPVQWKFHYELLPDSTAQFVDKCTYEEQERFFVRNPENPENTENQESQESSSAPEDEVSEQEASEFGWLGTYEMPVVLWPAEYMGEWHGDAPYMHLDDSGEYYTVPGTLKIDYAISVEDFDKLSEGDCFTILDKEFVLGERIRKTATREYFSAIGEFSSADYEFIEYPLYCINDDCTYYISTEEIEFERAAYDEDYVPRAPRFGTEYYEVEVYNTVWNTLMPIYILWDIQELKIAKDAYYVYRTDGNREFCHNLYMTETFETSGLSDEAIFALKEELRKEKYGEVAYTAEEFAFWDLEEFTVFFNKDGVIDTLVGW